MIGYDFESFAVTAYYVDSVYARNIAAESYYWLRFDVPLSGNTAERSHPLGLESHSSNSN